MRTVALVILAALEMPAMAGPVVRIGVVGGYDASAPGHREDGIAAGVGYKYGPWTAELDLSYLEYDGSAGVGGGASRAGILVQHELLRRPCENGTCPHIDLDLGIGRRWVTWQYDQTSVSPVQAPLSFSGRELEVGLSADFLLHLALHYVLFQPDSSTADGVACRSTVGCGGQTLPSIGNVGVLLEASFAFGGS